ncbi:MAG: hypothetical protein A3H96_24860 [Acidobacteria bacterium RIFCSPLOWO2_02_FULL_67_36]|nr:MAG: hypothetical protein A3H96_24860 [Acidobacteria bacterium RIFCSPLOWO2_02_FULL_67_36]OFW20738.1 MAG: hypothetical protein A3G21_22555 [Acidobacteria bacterium RIFCSPLOWO2_12_FULL_66_21]
MRSAAAIAGLVSAAAWPVQAGQSGPAARGPQSGRAPVFQTARANLTGVISGTVSDERGVPVPGAVVSVLGAALASDVTDAQGRFFLARLPVGEYVLRAHMSGFAASRSETVRLVGPAAAICRLQLRRLDAAAGSSTATASTPLASRPILAAGFELPRVEPSDEESKGDHPHGETAWRLRHLPRSILKDAASTIAVADAEPPAAGSIFARAADSAAGLAAAIFSDIPFTGEVNLLTTGAVAPANVFSNAALPRGVAYLSIGAPTGAGDWVVRAAMGEGDLSSWIVAGSFVSRPGSIHSYDFGWSYSTQEYQSGNSLALTAVTDGSRNVGELHALDRWTVSPGVAIEYGGRYAHYDYLIDRGLFSPRVGLTLEPVKGTRVKTVIARRMLAPGAEEFLAPGSLGPWLPPERTFAPLLGDRLRVERSRTLDVMLEHDFNQTYTIALSRFFQSVDDQLVTLFGVQMPSGPRSIGHYYVASAGAVDSEGWGVRLRATPSTRLTAAVDYRRARGQWSDRGDLARVAVWAPGAIRPELEDIHDLTTTVEAKIPETATRVFVLYKLDSRFTRADLEQSKPGLDGRFDVQVNQALPFGLGGTQWEILIGLRNLFRDPNDPASLYDELLVVRPPKRVVGGVLVRF